MGNKKESLLEVFKNESSAIEFSLGKEDLFKPFKFDEFVVGLLFVDDEVIFELIVLLFGLFVLLFEFMIVGIHSIEKM